MTTKFSRLTELADNLKQTLLSQNPELKGIGLVILDSQTRQLSDYKLVLNPEEIALSKNRLNSLSGRLAAKIAVTEALNRKILFTDLSILNSTSSSPLLRSPIFSGGIAPDNLTISITHEDNITAAIAVYSKNKILAGIDITRIKRLEKIYTDKKVLSYILSDLELKNLKSGKDLAVYWACKEASAKALGIGIWHGGYLRDIEISQISDTPELKLKNKLYIMLISEKFKKIKLNIISAAGYKLAVAITKS